jgi:3-phytase
MTWILVTASVTACSVSQAPVATAAPQPTGDARPIVETTPVANSGDAADDPAIWRDPDDPSRSIVIGNDKGGALEVYDLTGARLQRLTGGFYGNVDVRSGFATGTGTIDIAVAYRLGIRIYRIDPSSRQLVNVTDASAGSITSPIGGEGICLYRSPFDGRVYVFVNARDGRVAQLALSDADRDGLVEGNVVRQWDVGTEVEGCVADDELGDLYISEEDVGIWRYGAEPSDPTSPASRRSVDRTISAGGHIRPDAEGLTIVYQPGGTGYLIASSQAASDTLNSYLVYERQGYNAFVREFKVVAGAVDGCGRTDGIDALATDLGPTFPQGIFICQDNANTTPGNNGNQNFKFVPLESVVSLSTDASGNQPPRAAMDVACQGLSCSLDGSASSDPEGPLRSYAWTFGDGSGASTASTSHMYAAAGSYAVTLTVTDRDGGVDLASQVVWVSAPSTDPIAYVDRAGSNTNSNVHRIMIPSTVAAGDGLLMFFATNTSASIPEPTGVTGWTGLDTLTMSGAVVRAWSKTASSADAGATVQFTLPAAAKGNLTLLAYRGTDPSDPVGTFTSTIDASGRSSHTTPMVSVASAQAWVVSYWTHKDSTTTLLTPPSGYPVRSNSTQTGSGTVKGLVVDSGSVVGPGPYGGLTAVAGATASNATMWTIILAPNA